MPAVYAQDVPASLVVVFHGFYDTASGEISEDLLPAMVNLERKNVVT